MMTTNYLSKLHKSCKENSLFGRYITSQMIAPILEKHSSNFKISVIGYSVEQRPIHSVKIGNGEIKILIWSQMHGNESTTTKSLFDMFNAFALDIPEFDAILKTCTLFIIPILNPDGAEYYTRLNVNEIDLNRDAQDLTQPESIVLRDSFNNFKPHYCFNLHGQRTIFGSGNSGKPATLSFLAPAEDDERTVTETRKKAMSIISDIVSNINDDIPNAVGRYDDGFNINCVGDTFQSLNVPTVLFEAGHCKDDYDREDVRLYIFKSLLFGLFAVSNGAKKTYESYFNINENKKNFYDVIIRDAKLNAESAEVKDVAIQFKEVLSGNSIDFVPIIEAIDNLTDYYGHKEINANGGLVLNQSNDPLIVTHEIVFVMLNNCKILIKS